MCRCGSGGRYGPPSHWAELHGTRVSSRSTLGHPDELAEIVADLTMLRREAGNDDTEPFDVVAASRLTWSGALAAAGTTCWLAEFP